jgi:hypothetical protein
MLLVINASDSQSIRILELLINFRNEI